MSIQETMEHLQEQVNDLYAYILELEDANAKKQKKVITTCNRFEVIDKNGRQYVRSRDVQKIELSFQDNEKTLKIFVT